MVAYNFYNIRARALGLVDLSSYKILVKSGPRRMKYITAQKRGEKELYLFFFREIYVHSIGYNAKTSNEKK